jgi:O-antigen/teichoic acid export membrane protein
MLIAAGKYQDLDQLFFKIVKISTLTLALGAIILFALVYLLNLFGYPLSQRLLSPLPTALFLFAHSAMTISSYFAVYLRAHKKEPFLILSLISAFLISLSTWLLGRSLGEVGVAVGYTSVCIFFVLPYGLAIWSRYRSLWHGTK